MVRNIFALAILAPYIYKNYRNIFTRNKLTINILRASSGFLSMTMWFYAVSMIPIADAVSISFIVPSLTTIFAIIFLKEKINIKNWISIIIGFIGVLIIIRPGFKEFNIAYLLMIVSACFWAISNILTKILSASQQPINVVAYLTTIMTILSVPFGVFYIQPLTVFSIFLLIAMAIISNLSYFLLSKSYSKADLSIVQPFDFTRLIFSALIGYFIFDEKVDLLTIVGSLIILCGLLIALPKKNINQKPISSIST
jgi:drug/metabolite transporter (DMT)-like permease